MSRDLMCNEGRACNAIASPALAKGGALAIAFAGLLISASALAQDSPRSRGFYPNVAITTHDNLSLEFLNEAVPRLEDCNAAADMIANTVRASCPTCSVTKQQCPRELAAPQRKLLSEEPIEMPSSRLPNGIVAYLSQDPGSALAACQQTERLTVSRQGFHAICYPANTRRPLPAAGAGAHRVAAWQAGVGAAVLVLTGLIAAFTCFLIVRYESVHRRWSADPVEAGPQKFHATPTPRIGGLGIVAGLFVSAAALLATEPGHPSEQFGYLLLASLPAFLGGITEDATKAVSVLARLALTMLAAAVGVWLLGAVIPRLDVPGFDTLLAWTPFAIAFTVFAVGGVANAINIIDGYNGLAAGHAVIVLAAFAFVSAQVGDSFLFASALAMMGALLGFLVWNYPSGRIFLGDGGAYLLGFWLAELSVLLVARHRDVSPWFPMLLLVYPIFETLYSMYRRKIVEGLSPGQPDRMHLHQVIYQRLRGGGAQDSESPVAATRLNSRVAPLIWLMTLCCALPAVAFWRETRWLVVASVVFCLVYLLLYRRVLKSSGAA
jgi:UDP-N-acetylmuramyl pentapeptide phosphotransferase/UDP-N-acetylglucosamine-1-phosphate transferase